MDAPKLSRPDTLKAPMETWPGVAKTILLFTLLGPLIGALPWALIFYLADHGQSGVYDVLAATMVFGLLFGLGPALLAGTAFVVAVRIRIRRGGYAASRARLAVFGIALGVPASALFYALIGGFPEGFYLSVVPSVISGAACGVLCFPFIVRPLPPR